MPPIESLPALMREIHFDGAGGPDVIALREAPLPQLGAGEMLVQVAYAGVNRPDCLQRAGGYPPPPGAPATPGLEVAGRIVVLGTGTGSYQVGDFITALVAGGGYAEYCLVDAPLAMRIPAGLSVLKAAALPENVLTVYDNVITRGQLVSGESILIHGGSSGIGSIAIQMAKAHGARVMTTARGERKGAFCLALGADAVVDYSRDDFVPAALDFTKNAGFDVILDMVGGDYIARNLRCLGTEGRLVQIAFLKGSKAEIDFRHLMIKRQTITGSTLRPRSLPLKAAIAEAVRQHIWPLVEAGRIRPHIDRVFPLAEARLAHECMEASAHLGKIMLAVNPDLVPG